MANNLILPQTGYLAFDSYNFRQMVVDKLTQSGIITDTNYVGSNISVILDIVSMMYGNLLYYLNRTSTESMFSESQIYENMNRIVKMLDYKPIGKQTSTLSFSVSSNGINVGLYTIPRYSFINVNGYNYSLNEDVTLSINTSGIQDLSDFYNESLLYQGSYVEYPIQIAAGQDNETIYLAPGNNINIDHFNIDVYVNNINTNKWEMWTKTPSLYLENAIAKKYEIRYNENKNYEIKFGNNINGVALNTGDQIAVYYLQSDGAVGQVGANALQSQVMTNYATNQFLQILKDINATTVNYIDYVSIQKLYFDNANSSTLMVTEESVDSIRQNAPAVFRSQYHVTSPTDYEVFIKTNFANIIKDVKVLSNMDYLTQYMKYYYDLGITNPNDITSVFYNQINFASTCNFNNVYIVALPKATVTQSSINILTPAQKELIFSSLQDVKVLTSETVIVDPVYMAVELMINNSSTIDIANNNSYLYIIKDINSLRSNASIQNDVYNLFLTYFSNSNNILGQTLDIVSLTENILSVNGVNGFYVGDVTNTISYNGLSFALWNPIYPVDSSIVTKNVKLNNFQVLYYNNLSNLLQKIIIVDTDIFEKIEV
jgi:hypothetical protein